MGRAIRYKFHRDKCSTTHHLYLRSLKNIYDNQCVIVGRLLRKVLLQHCSAEAHYPEGMTRCIRWCTHTQGHCMKMIHCC